MSTGAGMSAESGITTFRDAGGLWENYPVMQVASADGFARDPELIHKFYNARRKELLKALPNAAHKALVDLEKKFDVYVITQNVDDLHERAGSSNVLHLHGELMKIRSVKNPDYTEELAKAHGIHEYSEEKFTLESIQEFFAPFLTPQTFAPGSQKNSD